MECSHHSRGCGVLTHALVLAPHQRAAVALKVRDDSSSISHSEAGCEVELVPGKMVRTLETFICHLQC